MSEGELRELLGAEDPRTRILAVWALGLRAGSSAMFVEQLAGEPAPGVRRALAVVLAGQGELDLLVALARHDPDVHVRAHAAQMVARFASAGRVPWEVVTDRFADHHDVRAAILSQIDAAAPPEIHERVVASLDDSDGSVRREAFETAVKLYMAGAVGGEALQRALDRATSGEVKNALVRWLELDHPSSIARALAGAKQTVRSTAIRMRPELALTDLVPLLEQDAELFEDLSYELKLAMKQAPIALVVRVALRTRWAERLAEAEARLAACDRLPELAADLIALHASCLATIADLDATLASATLLAELDDDGERPEDLWARRETLEALARHALRLGT